MNWNNAIKLNNDIKNKGMTPHERDLARMRLRILKKKRKQLSPKNEVNSHGRG